MIDVKYCLKNVKTGGKKKQHLNSQYVEKTHQH